MANIKEIAKVLRGNRPWQLARKVVIVSKERDAHKAKRGEYFARYVVDVINQASDDPRVKVDRALALVEGYQFYDAAEAMRGDFGWIASRAGFEYWSDLYQEMKKEGNYVNQ